MTTMALEQAASLTPPRRGLVLAIGVDATSRAYDLSSIIMGEYTPDGSGKKRVNVYLTLEADAGDVFYYFHIDNTATLDDTAKISAGGAIAYANTYAAKIKQDDRHEVLINRALDKFLYIKTSTGTAVLRLWASSMADQ